MDDDIAASVAAISRIDAVPQILEVICRSTGLGFAAVARVTSDRWVACAVRDEIAFGLVPGGELQVATTICDEIRDTGQGVVIDHVAEDEAFRNHPTPAMYGFQSYISIPILRGGEFFGTLCAIDPRPARLRTPQVQGMFKLFADLIGYHLETQDRLARSEAALLSERETAELRDQFIAVLGHDLRNPLAALDGGVRLLRRGQSPERAEMIMGQMENSVARMAALIRDVMDLARGRLGGELELQPRTPAPLAEVLANVVTEFRVAQPHRTIEAAFDIDQPVLCDTGRIAQLLSNLIANALTHGHADQPVRVTGGVEGDRFTLSVANAGQAIDPAVQGRLFQPYYRAAGQGEGLGLGLYIASQIARGHGGALSLSSTAQETRFTFTMPVPAMAGVSAGVSAGRSDRG